MGEISYRSGALWDRLTCFWGFCEVLPDRVNMLAEIGERAEQIDPARAEAARARAEARLKALKVEAGYQEARLAYVRAVTRLAVVHKRRPQ
jgi:F-type H+-transporting ATPase subunit epsilon